MENVSNALLLAATMLVFVGLLTIFVYLFSQYGSTSQEINKQIVSKQEQEDIEKFLKYKGTTCKIQDIASIANLANENNKLYADEYLDADFASVRSNLHHNWPFYICVKVDITGPLPAGCVRYDGFVYFERLPSKDIIIWLIKNKSVKANGDPYTFTCSEVEVDYDIKQAYELVFRENP